MRASAEQIQSILQHLGVVEAARRRLDVGGMSREQASDLLRKLQSRSKQRMVSTGGRPARPLSALPPHQQALIRDLAADPDDPRHGSQYGYGAGRCKCDKCVAKGRKIT